MAMDIPTNTPLQQQIDEFIAEGASWLPADLLQELRVPSDNSPTLVLPSRLSRKVRRPRISSCPTHAATR